MTGMKGLLPPSIRPSSTASNFDDETLSTLLDSKRKKKTLPSIDSGSVAQQSVGMNSAMSFSSAEQRSFQTTRTTLSRKSSEGGGLSEKFSRPSLAHPKRDKLIHTVIEENEEDSPNKTARSEISSVAYIPDRKVSFRSADGDDEGSHSDGDFSLALEAFNHELENSKATAVLVDDMYMLASRPFPLPTESKNCLVRVYCAKEYDENLRIVVVSPGSNIQDRLAERILTIDHAYDIVHANGHSSQLIHSTEQDDLQTLSAFLINMFKEADVDGSGSLTFDEFQLLMEQVELGISPQELRFVISEADENENGVVDYEEFVPLAVDLIQSFRARNRAKTLNSQQDVLVDDQILQAISAPELEQAAKVCLEKLLDYDKKSYGLIRVAEFKRCLNAVAASVGLRDSEINLLSQLLPRDQFGRLKYNSSATSFVDYLSKVRFMTMKNAMIESQGSGLQKYLLEMCKEEEKKYDEENLKNSRSGDLKTAPPGCIPCRSLIEILTNSPRLSLSRLQVLVIMSEASVLDGYINYYQFIPVVTKAIELMFEPKALRQRAELIARTDLSPEALLHGMGLSRDAFEQRLLTLFKSYDIDHNGTLDQNEFIACLESLELQLTKGEMVALMASADVAQHGFLNFDDFVKFFANNLLHLEREKRIRLLQSTMDLQQIANRENQERLRNEGQANGSSGISIQTQRGLGDQLLSIFELSDPNRTGFITYEDFESILSDFSMHSSPFLMDLLRSELHTATVDPSTKTSSDGENDNEIVLVEYAKSLATCADLFSVYRAKETAWAEHHEKESVAEEKASKIAKTQIADIQRISRYLLRRMKSIIPIVASAEVHATKGGSSSASIGSQDTSATADSSTFLLSRFAYSELQFLVRSPQAGLSRSEANIVLHRLLGPVFASPEGDSSPGITHSNSGRHLHQSITNRAVSNSPRLDGTTPAGQAVLQAHSPHHRHKSVDIDSSGHNDHDQRTVQQISGQDIFDAVFEARKTTIMRTILHPIDHNTLQRRIFQSLELVWKTDNNIPVEEADANNTASEDSLSQQMSISLRVASTDSVTMSSAKYLTVNRCYFALEMLNGLPVSRAQMMFVIAAADCYDKSGNLLEIHKLSEHIAQVLSQLIGAENIATRGAVVTHGRVDDRKALHGLKDTQLLRYLEHQLLGDSPEAYEQRLQDAGVTVEQLCQSLREAPRLQLTERDISTILAACGLTYATREVPLDLNIDALKILLAGVVDCVVALCRERMIHRRLSLCHSTVGAVDGAGGMQATLQEEGRKTLKALAEKLLYTVKLFPSDSITQEDARRFSGLEGAEYFYPLRIGLPGDSKLMRQHAAIEDSKVSLMSNTRKHHHQIHRLVSNDDTDGQKRRSKKDQKISAATNSTSVRDAGTELMAGSNDSNDVIASGEVSLSATQPVEDVYDEDPFEDDEDVSVLVLFKGSVFLPARIFIPPSRASNTSTTTLRHPSATVARKSSSDNVPSGSSTDRSSAAESRPTSSFPQRLQTQVQLNSTAVNFRTTRKAVMLQIVAVDNSGGLSLYSTSGSGLIAQAVSPDGSVVVPSAVLPLRLPSVGAVDKEAAEQFVVNILEKLYLEFAPSQPLSASSHTRQQQPPVSARPISSSGATTVTAPEPTHRGQWVLKMVDEED